MATKEDQVKVEDGRHLPFCQVDNALMRSPRLDAYAKAVYVILCGYTNLHSDACYPSLETIQKDLNISRPTVIKALRALEEEEVLEPVKRRDEKGRIKSNVYVIKDWRSTKGHRVNDIDSDAHVKVNDVDSVLKPRLLGSSVDLVNDVYPKDRSLEREDLKDIDLLLAESQEEDSPAQSAQVGKPKKTKTPKAAKQDEPKKPKTLEEIIAIFGENSTQHILREIEDVYGKPIPHYPKQGKEVKTMKAVGYTRQQIVGCWDSKYRKHGYWIELSWVTTDIGDFVKNGNKLPERRNGNGRHHPDASGIVYDPEGYAEMRELARRHLS